MKLPALFENPLKEHDPGKVVAYHEAGHGLIQVSFGLLPKCTSIIGFQGVIGFNSSDFYPHWDIGVDWAIEGPKYALMLYFAGVAAGAFYSGSYTWSQAGDDLEKAERRKDQFGLSFREYLVAWFDTHELIKEHSDLLRDASEKLYKEKALGWEYWEPVLLSPAKRVGTS